MIRPQSKATAVRTPESDDDMLRSLASCANETLDALTLPAPRVASALQRVVQRYGRILGISLRDLQTALQATPVGSISSPLSAPMPLAEGPN
jgi:non-specific serine/threonine protein kinase